MFELIRFKRYVEFAQCRFSLKDGRKAIFLSCVPSMALILLVQVQWGQAQSRVCNPAVRIKNFTHETVPLISQAFFLQWG